MLLSKGNPLLSRINAILLKIMETGFIDYWTGIVTRAQIADENKPIKGQQILTLDNLKGAFLLWFTGLTLSLFVFVGEKVKYNLSVRNTR